MAVVGIMASLALASIKAEAQYRANFVVMVLMGLLNQLSGLFFIAVVLSRFDAIAGWTLGDVAFLYGLRLLVHALRGVTVGNMGRVPSLIRDGEFDRFMVRPLNPLLQIIGRRVPINDLGNLIGGLGVFLYASQIVDVDWSPMAVTYLVLAILGGSLISAALQLGATALSFRLLGSGMLYSVINDVNNTFGHFPFSIYGDAVRLFLTFGLPIAFMAYFPATVLLGRTDELSVAPIVAYLSPLAGVITFAIAYGIWRFEIRRYQSAGH